MMAGYQSRLNRVEWLRSELAREQTVACKPPATLNRKELALSSEAYAMALTNLRSVMRRRKWRAAQCPG